MRYCWKGVLFSPFVWPPKEHRCQNACAIPPYTINTGFCLPQPSYFLMIRYALNAICVLYWDTALHQMAAVILSWAVRDYFFLFTIEKRKPEWSLNNSTNFNDLVPVFPSLLSTFFQFSAVFPRHLSLIIQPLNSYTWCCTLPVSQIVFVFISSY